MGNDFKKLGKLKKNIDEKRSRLAEVVVQISKFENATENFVNEQKLESNLVFIEETNNKKLEELQVEHGQQLKEIEIRLQKEFDEAENALTEKQLNRYKKSTETLDLEKKIEMARKKEDWDQAEFFNTKLNVQEEKDREVN